MSRLGKKPIEIPAKTEVEVSGRALSVKGPKGTMTVTLPDTIDAKIENNEVILVKTSEDLETAALWGTFASHITNMIEGVNKGFEKKLVIEGVGYRGEVKGTNVSLLLGFSHPIIMPIPEGITVVFEKNVITVSGIDKDAVGQFAAEIREHRKPEPYKGKGVRYEDEVVQRKQGKKSA